MVEPKHLELILCWHMHQPDYRDHTSGEFALPWTYLHAIKDYTDMAWYLEQMPGARAVFNFVPILLDQLEDYADQFATDSFRDPLLRLLTNPDLAALTATDRALIVTNCFRCNQATMIDSYPAYLRLQRAAADFSEDDGANLAYLSPQYFADLLMWYHLTWLGETVRRDDRLSDKIGFEYAKWLGKDAALDFIRELEGIADRAPKGETPVVSIIMDGENAWEYYPYNGFYFLSELYTLLAAHPRIRLTTFGEAAQRESLTNLAHVAAGSWVYGTFSTWIGDPAKNHAWALLCSAKQAYDRELAGGNLSDDERNAAARQLASCEASDWFWWPGDYNPSESVKSFDELYRRNLANLYSLLKLPAPEILREPLSWGAAQSDLSGAMRRVS